MTSYTRGADPSESQRHVSYLGEHIGTLNLSFPWGEKVSLPRESWPELLTPRQRRYLVWCLDETRTSSTRVNRLLSCLGFLTYYQVRAVDIMNRLRKKETSTWQ